MRLSAAPDGRRQGNAGGAPLLTACLAVCQDFHGRLQVRAKKAGHCWQLDRQIRPKWRKDRCNVRPPLPQRALFYLMEGFPIVHIPVQYKPRLPSSLPLTWVWNERPTLAATQGFIKRTRIWCQVGCSWPRLDGVGPFLSRQTVAANTKTPCLVT